MTEAQPSQERQTKLRRVLSHFPTGVIAVCALVDGEPIGIPVNSFTSISLDPPLVSISVAKTSTTWPKLSAAKSLGLSVLGSSHAEFCRTLAIRGRPNKFAEVDWSAPREEAVFIENSAAWLECKINAVFVAGDHEIVVLDILSEEAFSSIDPLLFHMSDMRSLN